MLTNEQLSFDLQAPLTLKHTSQIFLLLLMYFFNPAFVRRRIVVLFHSQKGINITNDYFLSSFSRS